MNGHDETPEGRLAFVVWSHVLTKERNSSRVNLPELRVELAPHLQLIILTEVLKTVQKYGSYVEALKIVEQMETLKQEIATRKK